MEKAKRGRKPLADKKTNITIYLKRSKVESLGGKESIKQLIHQTLQTHEQKES